MCCDAIPEKWRHPQNLQTQPFQFLKILTRILPESVEFEQLQIKRLASYGVAKFSEKSGARGT